MNAIFVKTDKKQYPIDFYKDFQGLPELIQKTGMKGRKFCIITDSNIADIYVEELKDILKNCCGKIYCYKFEAGENSKNLDTISDFYRFFIENRFDRKTIIAGLGGGVTGDMAGFSAATYLRGIPFIQIPTSLLAQVDSSVGGKVGVDFCNSKNIIGAFYQPHFVYINTGTLKTLSEREFNAGMAEVIKYGMIVSSDFYCYIQNNKCKIKAMEDEIITKMISDCCIFKADVVSKDEKESGLREILNFGHTIGHAIETLMEFKLVHGECVGIGMTAAVYISYKKGNITKEELDHFKELLIYFNIPTKVKGLEINEVYKQLFLDKKVKDNKIGFVLLDKIGKAYSTSTLTEDEIMDGIKYVL